MSRITLLGVPIDAITATDAVEKILTWLDEETQRHVMTPNNEMLVEASRNGEFHTLLNQADLNLPDSTGLLVGARQTKQELPERVTGIDTVKAICTKLSDDHSIFLLGAAEGVATHAAAKLQKSNPHLKIAGTYSGSPKDDDADAIVARINSSGAHLLLVAYGAPQQDLWIHKHLRKMPTVRVAMGVGGTFDFLAGRRARAPKWMQSLGLEWLWRFVQEPTRWRRMWNAVVVFPALIGKHGRKNPL